ncbi:MAG: PepSY-associated TM helix domain-containing protein [Azonexus sp.]
MPPALLLNGRKLRTPIHNLHKWLGLTFGLLFALLGLTGSLLVFYPELDLALNPQRAVIYPSPEIPSFNRIVEALQQAEPARRNSWRIELPRGDDSPITARYYRPIETAHRAFAPLILTLDPATLQVTSQRFWGDDPLTWLYDLHYSLLLEKTGKTVLGIASLLILIVLISGLYLGWPTAGKWRSALTFKSGAVWKRRIYDLHAKAGLYGLLLLITLTATGQMLVVPGWFTPAIERFSPLKPLYQASDPARPMEAAISADEAVRIARHRFPGAEVRWIHTPAAEHAVWRIQMRQSGEPNRRFPRTNVWIDALTGKILAIRDPQENSAGDTLMDWLHPLHNGEAFGLPGRITAFICGLLPLLAFVTGFIRWRHKQRPAIRR